MINFIRRYIRYIIFVFSIVIVSVLGIIFYDNDNKSSIVSEKKLSSNENIKKEETKKEDKSKEKTVYVDVKGAVNSPGVYELNSDKRVIDAINLAGGLQGEADTININLSLKVKDEMYIMVYTKTEIYNYKKNNETSSITCASVECICPDKDNDACIKKDNENTKKSKTAEDNKTKSNNKVSLNNASKEELMTLNGIGESKANAIINYRNENGKFSNIEDIKNVSGIGEALFNKIKDNLTL